MWWQEVEAVGSSSIVAGEVRDFEVDAQKVSTARSAALRLDDGGCAVCFVPICGR